MKKLLTNLTASLASVVKIMLYSRGRRKARSVEREKSIVLLGNGPSLRQTIDSQSERLAHHSLMAVNYAALADDFMTLRPDYYIMIDPIFFPAEGHDDKNTAKVWNRLGNADWQLTLFVPHGFAGYARRRLEEAGANSKVVALNLVPVEGFRFVAHTAYNAGLGMPRPRNVLIAACMAAISEGFGKIYLAGADHSWTQTLSVDEDNQVCNTPLHFYKEKSDPAQVERARAAYRGLHLHDVFESLRIAFRSYFDVKAWAESRGVEIYNSTPGSMIDAFPRREIP